MDKRSQISAGTNFRKVYLEDLKAVMDIYQHTDKLTLKFGLPLAIAECNKKLLGYAAAKLNDLEEIVIECHFRDQHEQPEIKQELEQLALQTVHTTFNGPETSIKLKHASQRLIEWLNQCD